MRKTKSAIVVVGEYHFQKTALSRMGEFCLKKMSTFCLDFFLVLSKADAKTKIKYEEQIKELRQNVEEAQQTLTKIRDANENTWEDLKQGAETIWDMYKNSFKKAKSEFKQGYREGLEE
ncbi:MAG: hypothetical protein K9N10_14125, partial [Deltaproteobacteria bacterium]|nr:hypothetical protein [Deltaproteobacteria bacterium]